MMKLNVRKVLFFVPLFWMTSVLASQGAVDSGKDTTRYTVDTESSRLQWVGRRIGSSHDGHVKLSSGHLVMRGSALVSGEFVINMESIKVDDIKDADRNARLLNHLKNDDFFSVDKFSAAKLVIKDVQTGKGGAANVVADLTIKGETHPVMFEADITVSGDSLKATAKILFDRTVYGIRYRSGNFFQDLGDRAINDMIEINVTLEAKK
jgi:polyisoprenoid-binding protein YceI